MQPQNMRDNLGNFPQANDVHSGFVGFSIFGESYFSSLMMRCPLLGGAFFLFGINVTTTREYGKEFKESARLGLGCA